MNKSTGIIFGAIALVIVIVIAGVTTMNGFVRSENNVVKFNSDSENVLSNYTMKLQEVAQVPDMYIGALKGIVQETFQGRYGQNGSQAVMQWIKEQNLQVDSTMFKEIQIVVKAGRDEFRISQTKKLDVCAAYKNDIQTFPGNVVAGIFGYPRIDLEKSCQVISDARTQEAFRSGTQSAIKIGG